jgi:hypothetical protein
MQEKSLLLGVWGCPPILFYIPPRLGDNRGLIHFGYHLLTEIE